MIQEIGSVEIKKTASEAAHTYVSKTIGGSTGITVFFAETQITS